MQATVFKSTGSFYIAYDDKGKKWNCRIRGRLKIDEEISSSNPVAIGDRVMLSIEDENTNAAVISEILPRHNYMVRSSPHNRHQKHIVAANMDQALIIATIIHPRTSLGFIDRFLITAEAYHIPAIIVFNKADLLTGKYQEEWKRKKTIYEQAGYKTITLSATIGKNLDSLTKELTEKTSLFSGHSGVGKSTLINLLAPELNLRVGDISLSSGKGKHTTTFAEMFALPQGGYIIDTPGVKEFGVIDINAYELSHYFPEMKQLIGNCKFNNCIHVNEPDCTIKKAVEDGSISIERYESYLSILSTL